MNNKERLALCIAVIETEATRLHVIADELKKIDASLSCGIDFDDVSKKYISLYCSMISDPGFNRRMFQELSGIGMNLAWGEKYEKN